VAGFMADRGVAASPEKPSRSPKELEKGRGRKAEPVVAGDPELDEIEALLRKHGIQ